MLEPNAGSTPKTTPSAPPATSASKAGSAHPLFPQDIQLKFPSSCRNKLTHDERDAFLEFIENRGLTDEQLEEVRRPLSPGLVLAGAGTGKTFLIENRIAYLIACGLQAKRILAISFSRKAAKELENRCRKIISPFIKAKPKTLTFHTLGRTIIDEFGYVMDINKPPKIERHHKESLLLRALEHVPGDVISAWSNDNQQPHLVLENTIKRLKLKNIVADEVLEKSPSDAPIQEAYRWYEHYLRSADLIDYEDYLLLPVRLFQHERGEDIVGRLHDRYEAVIVDEHQDTNALQEIMARAISERPSKSGPRNGLLVVGDDDQSIYGFCGADVNLIQTFPERYDGATVSRLQTNFRSYQSILDVSNDLMAAAKTRRHSKTLRSARGDGPPVWCRRFESVYVESQWIANSIQKRLEDSKCEPKDIAILLRSRSTGKLEMLKEALDLYGVPYHDCFESHFTLGEIERVVHSLFSAIHDPRKEDPAFFDLFRASQVGMTEEDVDTLVELRNHYQHRFWNCLQDIENLSLSPEGRKNALRLRIIIENLHQRVSKEHRYESLANIAFDGVRELFPEATRSDNWNDPNTGYKPTRKIRAIIGRLKTTEKRKKDKGEKWTLLAFNQYCLEEIDRQEKEGKDKLSVGEVPNRVKVASIHSQKGGEFPIVYVPRLIEGALPSFQSIESDNVEEERRVMYVALTRAQNELVLSYPLMSVGNKNTYPTQPSRFLHDCGVNQKHIHFDPEKELLDFNTA